MFVFVWLLRVDELFRVWYKFLHEYIVLLLISFILDHIIQWFILFAN